MIVCGRFSASRVSRNKAALQSPAATENLIVGCFSIPAL
jgi:hypothetical protein